MLFYKVITILAYFSYSKTNGCFIINISYYVLFYSKRCLWIG